MQDEARDSLVKGLGRMTANFALLEMEMCFLIWVMIGSDQPVGAMVTSQMSFKNLVGLMSALGHHHFKGTERLEAIRDACREANRVAHRRNAPTHSTYVSDEETGSPGRLKFHIRKGQLQFTAEELDPMETNNVADEIADVADLVRAVVHGLQNHRVFGPRITQGMV